MVTRTLTSILALLLLLQTPALSDVEKMCARCGDVIDGAHFRTDGKYYHPEHFACFYCNRPIKGRYTEHKQHNYHNDCFTEQIALRCSLCNGVIEGEYLHDFWGNSYHRHHDSVAPSCDSCSRFISPELTGGGVRYDDGRYICAICHPNSITDIDDILVIVREVALHMKSFGMDVDYKGLQVHLVGREQMQDVAKEHSNSLRGFTDYTEDWRLFGKARNRKLNVYLLYGMPRMELISTIAHELAHIWQFNHGRFDNDQALCEGSCNYAAFLVLRNYSDEESKFFQSNLATDNDRVYGDGFRRVKKFAEAEGSGTWLKHLRKKSNWPAGY